jgi:hypothetical protein
MPQQNKDYALVLGINDYPKYRSLKGAIPDAREFAKWLVDDVRGGGLPSDHVETIISTASPIRPVRDQIDDALNALLDKAKNDGGGRRFYLFFSGHGLADLTSSISKTALCLGLWSESRRNYAMDAECYTNFVVHSQKFTEVVLFADCCRVRKVSAHGQCPTYENIVPHPSPGSVKQFRAHAADLMDQAFEAAVGADQEVRGHFSRALMNALWGAAAESGGGVKALRLKKYLEDEVPRIALASNHKQKPVVVPEFATADEPVFGCAVPTPSQPNVRITFTNTGAGLFELEGPQIDQLQQCDANAGTWDLTLTAGNYILRRKSGGLEKRIRVESVVNLLEVNDAS